MSLPFPPIMDPEIELSSESKLRDSTREALMLPRKLMRFKRTQPLLLKIRSPVSVREMVKQNSTLFFGNGRVRTVNSEVISPH